MLKWISVPAIASVSILPLPPDEVEPCAAPATGGALEAHLRAAGASPAGELIVVVGPAEGQRRICGLDREVYPVVTRYADDQPRHAELAVPPGTQLDRGSEFRIHAASRCDADPAYLSVSLQPLRPTSTLTDAGR